MPVLVGDYGHECERCTETDFHGESIYGNYYCRPCADDVRKEENE